MPPILMNRELQDVGMERPSSFSREVDPLSGGGKMSVLPCPSVKRQDRDVTVRTAWMVHTLLCRSWFNKPIVCTAPLEQPCPGWRVLTPVSHSRASTHTVCIADLGLGCHSQNVGLYPSSCSCEEEQARPASGLQYMTCPPYSLSRFKKWQKCSEIFCMHSFRALIGRVVRRQNVICDTPTSLGAREQPDNLILTRLATNAGHRAMSNLHSTNLQSTIPP